MPNIMDKTYNVKYLDEISRRKNFINNLHPLSKMITTIIYIFVLASFGRYQISGMLPLILYPIIVISVCDIPFGKLFKRVLFIEPFIVVAGILNPILDRNTAEIFGFSFSTGWLTFFSLALRSTLMVTAGFLLIATTTVDDIAGAMKLVKIPSIFVLLFLLTYRYIFVLLDEAERLMRAYTLRAPDQKGVNIKVWGTMVGQLLIRTYNRAQTIYQSMILKGYNGKYHGSISKGFNLSDTFYLIIWTLFFAAARLINLPVLITLFMQHLRIFGG